MCWSSPVLAYYFMGRRGACRTMGRSRYVLFHFWPVQVADEPEGDPGGSRSPSQLFDPGPATFLFLVEPSHGFSMYISLAGRPGDRLGRPSQKACPEEST